MSSSFDFSKSKIPAKVQQSKTSKSTGVKELEYDDKRGESVAQLKLQDAADNSKSVNNLVDIEEQANNSNQVAQLMEIQNTPSLNDGIVQFGGSTNEVQPASAIQGGASKGSTENVVGKKVDQTIVKAKEVTDLAKGADGTDGLGWMAEENTSSPITYDSNGQPIITYNSDSEALQHIGDTVGDMLPFLKVFSGMHNLGKLKHNLGKGKILTLENMQAIENIAEGAEGVVGATEFFTKQLINPGENVDVNASRDEAVGTLGIAEDVAGAIKDSIGVLNNFLKASKALRELSKKDIYAKTEAEKKALRVEIAVCLTQLTSDGLNAAKKIENVINELTGGDSKIFEGLSPVVSSIQALKNALQLIQNYRKHQENQEEIDNLDEYQRKEKLKFLELCKSANVPLIDIENLAERERVLEAHESNLKANEAKGKKGAHTRGVTEKKTKDIDLSLFNDADLKEMRKILDQYTLLEELIQTKKKQSNRAVISDVDLFLKVIGNIMKAVPEVQSVLVGTGLVLGGTALKMGAAAARETKQAGRDKAAGDSFGSGALRAADFDTSKSTAAKRDRRLRHAETLEEQTGLLISTHGTRESWKQKNETEMLVKHSAIKSEIDVWKKSEEGVAISKKGKAAYQKMLETKEINLNKKYPIITYPTKEAKDDYEKNYTMLKAVDIDHKKIQNLVSNPDKFTETIYKGLVNRDL